MSEYIPFVDDSTGCFDSVLAMHTLDEVRMNKHRHEHVRASLGTIPC